MTLQHLIPFRDGTKFIHNEVEYQAALKRIRELGEPEKGSPEDEEAEILTRLLVKYEEENYSAEELDPIEYLKTRMKVLGLAQNDLVPYFGTIGNVSKVLTRKRSFNLQNIRALKKGLGLSADILISGSDYAMLASYDLN